MTFLNPLILFGLAAAAIPLIIHLFNFRKPQRVDFSTLVFLKELEKTTMQRVRIKQWLLLLLRTLAIACLVLAFSRPTLTSNLSGTIGGQASSSIAIVIDNSLSMTLRDGQGAYLEQAQRIANGIINEKAPNDEVFVVTTSDNPALEPSAYTNRGPALDAVESLTAQAGATPLTRALGRAVEALTEARNLNKEIYLISDLQRQTLRDSLLTTLSEDIRTYLIPVGTRSFGNVAVTDVQMLSRIVEEGQPVRMQATLANYGSEPVQGYIASVYLAGERVAQATADLAPGERTTVNFTATPTTRGWLSGQVQIEDDAFEYDNIRHFTLGVPERRRILLVQGEAQRTEFVALALSSELTRGRVVFEQTTIPESALAATNLGAYDAVVLVGPRTLSSGEVVTLARYVEDGGGVLLFPGGGAQLDDYNALLADLGGGRFTSFVGELGPGPVVSSFDRVDLEHPLFEGLLDAQASRGQRQLESPDIFYVAAYEPAAATEQTLIGLSTRSPFLHEVRHGRGALLLMAVAPAPTWSDLPVRGLFVPLLYRTLYYLSASEAVFGEQLTVGEPGELRLPAETGEAPLVLVSPDGETYTPEQRALFGAALLQTDATIATPGVYDIRRGDAVVRRVAFNLDSRESDLRIMPAAEAAETLEAGLGAPVRVLEVGEAEAASVLEALTAERTGVEVWNVFLLFALVFLVAEMVVAKQWRPEEASA